VSAFSNVIRSSSSRTQLSSRGASATVPPACDPLPPADTPREGNSEAFNTAGQPVQRTAREQSRDVVRLDPRARVVTQGQASAQPVRHLLQPPQVSAFSNVIRSSSSHTQLSSRGASTTVPPACDPLSPAGTPSEGSNEAGAGPEAAAPGPAAELRRLRAEVVELRQSVKQLEAERQEMDLKLEEATRDVSKVQSDMRVLQCGPRGLVEEGEQRARHGDGPAVRQALEGMLRQLICVQEQQALALREFNGILKQNATVASQTEGAQSFEIFRKAGDHVWPRLLQGLPVIKHSPRVAETGGGGWRGHSKTMASRRLLLMITLLVAVLASLLSTGRTGGGRGLPLRGLQRVFFRGVAPSAGWHA